jgi:hypothetical protein
LAEYDDEAEDALAMLENVEMLQSMMMMVDDSVLVDKQLRISFGFV